MLGKFLDFCFIVLLKAPDAHQIIRNIAKRRNYPFKHGPHSPGRVPLFRVVACDRETYLSVDIIPPIVLQGRAGDRADGNLGISASQQTRFNARAGLKAWFLKEMASLGFLGALDPAPARAQILWRSWIQQAGALGEGAKLQCLLHFVTETSAYSQKDNVWRTHWVIIGKLDFPMIDAVLIGCAFRASDSEMPIE